MTETVIEAVQHNNYLDLLEQIHDFFHRWKQQEGQEATLEKLVEGLRAAKLQDCLSKLETGGLIPKGTFKCTSCTTYSSVHCLCVYCSRTHYSVCLQSAVDALTCISEAGAL